MLASAPKERAYARDDRQEKRSLASILRDYGPLSVVDAVDVALDVCDGLANAHANGVVHGDLGLHRVRTVWPRVPGECVDIFSLGESDSAAFAFRASAIGGLVAPEQRDGRVVDTRADVWAVGALLHWMIAGSPPVVESLHQTLSKAPRSLLVTIEACLDVDPAKRPQSVDEIAEVIGSLASSPPERFEQLARRRARLESSKLIGVDASATELYSDSVIEPLIATARRNATSAIFEKGLPVPSTEVSATDAHRAVTPHRAVAYRDLVFDSDENDIETVLAQPRYEPRASPVASSEPVASVPPVLSIASVVLPAENLAPPRLGAPAAPVSAPRRKSWTLALVGIAAVVAIVFGVGLRARLLRRAASRHVATTHAPSLIGSSAPSAVDAAMTPHPSTAIAPAAPVDDLPLTTPSSLPDAHLVTPSSLPDAPVVPRSLARPSAPAPRPRPASVTR